MEPEKAKVDPLQYIKVVFYILLCILCVYAILYFRELQKQEKAKTAVAVATTSPTRSTEEGSEKTGADGKTVSTPEGLTATETQSDSISNDEAQEKALEAINDLFDPDERATDALEAALDRRKGSESFEERKVQRVKEAFKNIPRRFDAAAIRESVVKRVEPNYPSGANSSVKEKNIEVLIKIDENGSVLSAAEVTFSSSAGEAAVEAARQWKFKPYYVSGKPKSAVAILTFHYKPN